MSTDKRALEHVHRLLSKADELLAAQRKPSNLDVSGNYVDEQTFSEWRSQSRAFLESLCGQNHVYFKDFEQRVEYARAHFVERGRGILAAVADDLERGFLAEIRQIVVAEIFSDFISMAGHLLDASYKDPAAMLAGAVLEDGLRRIATSAEVKVGPRDDLSSLNQKLAAKPAYSRLVQSRLQVWIKIRNHAAHGEFDQYGVQDVKEMISGIEGFLAEHV